MTMVLEALKKPMPMMAPVATQIGGGCDRQRAKETSNHQASTNGDPLARIKQSVERAEAEHAGLIGKNGDQQDVASRDWA
jgi:hypothetical protein